MAATKLLLYSVHRPCLKKTVPTYFLVLFCQIWTDFRKKLEGLSRNKPLTKLCLNCPLHLKFVLALPWEISSARLSHQRNNEVHIWMINWIVTNITGSYCLLSLKKVTRVTSHHLYCSVCSKCPVQYEHKRVDIAPLSDSTFNNRVTRSGPLAVDVWFQFVDIRDLGTIDLLLINVK